jgi:ligand-binding sensor domain-containing protein
MNIYFIYPFILLFLFSIISCERPDQNPEIKDELPQGEIIDIAIDRNGNPWFVTSAIDEDAMASEPWRCSLPVIYKLTEYKQDKYFIVRDPFLPVQKIQFDYSNVLWAITYNQLLRIDGQSDEVILELPGYVGYFEQIGIESTNTIWVGGMNTGLYRISEGNYTHYNTENSILPSDSISVIYIDHQDNVWVTIADSPGILKIIGAEWIIVNRDNNDIPAGEYSALTVDSHDKLWIGSRSDNYSGSLFIFDGTTWSTLNPEDGNGHIISGTFRKLLSDQSDRIWAVIDTYQPFVSHLIYFDGSVWNKVTMIPEEVVISDIELDLLNRIWVGTYNHGYYILEEKSEN